MPGLLQATTAESFRIPPCCFPDVSPAHVFVMQQHCSSQTRILGMPWSAHSTREPILQISYRLARVHQGLVARLLSWTTQDVSTLAQVLKPE